MNKLLEVRASDGGKLLLFHCPGCGYDHYFRVEAGSSGGTVWRWNGDRERPTFSPSLGVNMQMPQHRCHSFVEDGRIRFLNDSFHELAGQTVDLPPFDQNDGREGLD